MTISAIRLTRASLLATCLGPILVENPAEAGGPWSRRRQGVVVAAPRSSYVPTGYPGPNANAPTPMLGTFYPGPTATIRGNAPTGGGYSPLGTFGDSSLSFYGPLSSFRSVSAPVQTYSRGYDGRVYSTRGTAFSYPFLPGTGPVVYPTQATNAYGFIESGTPPWWKDGSNWVDQN